MMLHIALLTGALATTQAIQLPQEPPTPTAQAAAPADDPACEGCPQRSVGKALLWSGLYINGLYEAANLIRGQDTANITPRTWWLNMERGWEWDLDDFVVNQIGHPYQGSNYFTAGRAHGLSFWESAAVTAFGSGTWEYFGETNQASLNDFINTTLGGIALGEMFHRVGWLVRDTTLTGRARTMREIGATVLDPITGATRFLSGDASRVSAKPSEFDVPVRGFLAAGSLWRTEREGDFTEAGSPFVEADLLYGTADVGKSRTPFDAFAVRLRLGGGSAISEARVRGRLLGLPTRAGMQFNITQAYDYANNNAYEFGAQSFEASLGRRWPLARNVSARLSGWGVLTALGAVDSLGVPGKEPEGPTLVQGESIEPRFYDYGPGTGFGGRVTLSHRDADFLILSYDARHLYVIDGPRANHLLQQGRLDLQFPLRRSLGLGVSGEYFQRKTYYQGADTSDVVLRFPQVRVFLTWGLS